MSDELQVNLNLSLTLVDVKLVMSNFTYVFIAEGCLWLKLSAKIELRGSVKLQLAQLRD